MFSKIRSKFSQIIQNDSLFCGKKVSYQTRLFGGISHPAKKNPHPRKITIPKKFPGVSQTSPWFGKNPTDKNSRIFKIPNPRDENPQIFKNPEFPWIKIPRFQKTPDPRKKYPNFKKSPVSGIKIPWFKKNPQVSDHFSIGTLSVPETFPEI